MRAFTPLAPVPEGYFEDIRASMSDAALDQVIFDFSPIWNETLSFNLRQSALLGEFFDSEGGGWFGSDPLGEAFIIDAYQSKVQRIAAASLRMHNAIVEVRPKVKEAVLTLIDVRIHNLEPSNVPDDYHTDGGTKQHYLGYTACDNLGTVCERRVLPGSTDMPTGMINEFYPNTRHKPPTNKTSKPQPRTFVRFLYYFDLLKN